MGIVIYTAFGGLKATFLTDYVNASVIFIALLIVMITTYGTSNILGSPTKVYEMLNFAALEHPVEGNAMGQYATMASQGGGIFGVINIIGNFGTGLLRNDSFSKIERYLLKY